MGFVSVNSSNSLSSSSLSFPLLNPKLTRASSTDKSKYLLAAESVQGMKDWIGAIEFWSARKGR